MWLELSFYQVFNIPMYSVIKISNLLCKKYPQMSTLLTDLFLFTGWRLLRSYQRPSVPTERARRTARSRPPEWGYPPSHGSADAERRSREGEKGWQKEGNKEIDLLARNCGWLCEMLKWSLKFTSSRFFILCIEASPVLMGTRWLCLRSYQNSVCTRTSNVPFSFRCSDNVNFDIQFYFTKTKPS